jgi:multisubunit Na+/H+ antiporter MnhC subunit
MADLALLGRIFYGGSIGLVALGIYAIAASRDLIRALLGLALLEAGANLFLMAVGFRPDAAAPIVPLDALPAMVDPIPQAMILTTIVIGVGVLALGLALAVRLHERLGTLDTRAVAAHLAEDEPDGAAPPARRGA